MNKTQTKQYLESILNGSVAVDIHAALECFRSHYRANLEKLELLLSESAELELLHDFGLVFAETRFRRTERRFNCCGFCLYFCKALLLFTLSF